MPDPSTPQDRAAWRSGLRRAAYDLPSPPAVTGTAPDPEDPETWAFDGPEDYSGTMPALPPAHVIYCRGCQHAWAALDVSLIELDAGTRAAVDDCACTCADDTDPRYEDWVTDPDPADIPPGAWEN